MSLLEELKTTKKTEIDRISQYKPTRVLAFGDSQFRNNAPAGCHIIAAAFIRVLLGFYEFHCTKPTIAFNSDKTLDKSLFMRDIYDYTWDRIWWMNRQWNAPGRFYPHIDDIIKLDGWNGAASTRYMRTHSNAGMCYWFMAAPIRIRADHGALLNEKNINLALRDLGEYACRHARVIGATFTQGASSCAIIVMPDHKSIKISAEQTSSYTTSIYIVIDSHGSIISEKTAGAIWHTRNLHLCAKYMHTFLTNGQSVDPTITRTRSNHIKESELLWSPQRTFTVSVLSTELVDAKEPSPFNWDDYIRAEDGEVKKIPEPTHRTHEEQMEDDLLDAEDAGYGYYYEDDGDDDDILLLDINTTPSVSSISKRA